MLTCWRKCTTLSAKPKYIFVPQERPQCGVDTHGKRAEREPITWVQGQSPWSGESGGAPLSWKPFSFWQECCPWPWTMVHNLCDIASN